jgi:uncharacterized membrane protein YsdA (DUF1294 family)
MLSGMDTVVLIGIFLAVNVASFLAYYLDKRAAIRKARRIPERTLLIMALVAPFGAAGGMRTFHHKTKKTKFLLVYAFLALHVALIIYVVLPKIATGVASLIG